MGFFLVGKRDWQINYNWSGILVRNLCLMGGLSTHLKRGKEKKEKGLSALGVRVRLRIGLCAFTALEGAIPNPGGVCELLLRKGAMA